MSLIIKLNGSNYVSEKRRTAFEAALEQAPIVRRGNGHNGNGANHNGHKGNGNGADAPAPTATTPPPAAIPLEAALDHLFAHQEATLRVHEHYLHNQGEYARLFSQLLEQQGRIFAEGNGDPRRTEAAVRVITELSQSMARFHEMQREALELHRHFLAQQADYGRAYLHLLEMQPVALDAVHAAPAPPPAPVAAALPDEESAPAWDDDEPVARTIPPQPVPVEAAQPAPAAQAPAAPAADLTAALLAIVAEKTGYPPEMLDLTMDMEADLGIDSIKRVEILAALQEQFPHLPEIEADVLAELRTLGEIIAQIEQAEPSPKA